MSRQYFGALNLVMVPMYLLTYFVALMGNNSIALNKIWEV